MARIKPNILSKLQSDEKLQLAIADGLVKKISTIKKWIRDEDFEMLSSDAVVLLISKATGLSENEILEPEKATA